MLDKFSAEWSDVQGQRYPGYGVCIYCGSDGGADGLRDEHVIPLSLNGDVVIRKASCQVCERKINPADTHLAKAVFWHFRLHTGAKTRNPKDRPRTITAEIETASGKFARDFQIADAPFSVALPVWGAPGFFRGASIDAPFPETYFNIYHWMPPNMRETLGLGEDEDFRIWSSGRVSGGLFARALAKIAYCHTVIRYGLNGFRPLVLPKIILGECPAAAYFVGSPLVDSPAPLPSKALHAVESSELVSKDGILKLIYVQIRLFANSAYKTHGMPIYHVVAGAPKSTSSNINQ